MQSQFANGMSSIISFRPAIYNLFANKMGKTAIKNFRTYRGIYIYMYYMEYENQRTPNHSLERKFIAIGYKTCHITATDVRLHGGAW